MYSRRAKLSRRLRGGRKYVASDGHIIRAECRLWVTEQPKRAELTISADIRSVVLSLPHRGRLSLLCDPDLLNYSPTQLFSKIKGQPEFDPATAPGATGDVISHLAAIRSVPYGSKSVKVEMLQNPSHLEVSQKLSQLQLTTPGSQPSRIRGDSRQANVSPQVVTPRMPAGRSRAMRTTARRCGIRRPRCSRRVARTERSAPLR